MAVIVSKQIKVPSDLPAGYTLLNFVQSSGTQFIDTGVVVSAATLPHIRIVADVAILTTRHGAVSGSQEPYFYFGVLNNKFGFAHGLGAITTSADADTNRHTFELDAPNGKFAIRDFGIEQSAFFSSTSSAVNNIYICALSAGPYTDPHEERVYSEKIYYDGTLVRDFVPCINPQNVIGLYDKVGKQFYGNAGSGSFIGG